MLQCVFEHDLELYRAVLNG